MAIILPQGFEITSKQPIDTRIVLSKADMVSISDGRMPQVYLATCLDDGKLYLYNKANTVDPVIGKFRLLEGGSGSATWGSITGTLSDQTDLQGALDKKLDYQEGDTLILNCNL